MDRNPSSVNVIQSIPPPSEKKQWVFSAVSRQANWFKALKPANKSAMQPSLKAATDESFNEAAPSGLISALKISCVIGTLGETHIL